MRRPGAGTSAPADKRTGGNGADDCVAIPEPAHIRQSAGWAATIRFMATTFAPHLYLRIVSPAIAFYTAAFNAGELRRWSNPDGSVHVAEMALDGALFHLHEERLDAHQLSPETTGTTSSQIGVFVDDPDGVFAMAVEAGGRLITPCRRSITAIAKASLPIRSAING